MKGHWVKLNIICDDITFKMTTPLIYGITREHISCGYCLITKGLVIQEHPIDLVCQQQANHGGGTNVYSLGLQGCKCKISPMLV